MTNGLKKIYLSNSVFKANLVELDCFGHTNVSGKNASGKTTLLSLIPVFYGIEPNKMVTRAGDKTNFEGYYLPNKHSMVVFQYSKGGEDFCSILYRNGDNVAYRFITGAADDTLFRDDLFKTLTPDISVKDWLRDVVSQEHQVSIQLTTAVDYRAVIQNDKSRTRAKRKQGHGLMVAASRYSLCDTNTEMKHIEALSAVLINKDKLLSKFKSMVVDSFLTDQINIGDSPYHRDDRDYVESLQLLINLQAHEKDFKDAIESNEDLKSSWSMLLAIYASLSEHSKETAKQLTEDGAIKTQTEQALKEKSLIGRERIDEASKAVYLLQNKVESQTTIINNIQDARDTWDNVEDIGRKIAEYECLSDFIAQADKDVQHYEQLIEMVNQERAGFETKQSQAETKSLKEIGKLKERIEAVRAEIEDKRQQAIQENQARTRDYHNEKDRYTESRETELDLLRHKHTECIELKALAASYTKMEAEKLQETETQINAIDDEISELRKKHEQAVKEHADAEGKRDSSLTLRDKKQQLLASKRDERERLLALLSPQDNSLRAYLNNNVPDWHQTIGKIARPEILAAKGLSPTLVESNELLMGVSLNLDNIETPEYAQKNEVLEQRKVAIEKDIANLEADIKTLDAKLKLENKAVNDTQLLVMETNNRVKTVNKNKEQVRLRRSNFVNEFNKAIKERVIAAEAQLKKVNEDIDGFKRKTKEKLAFLLDNFKESELQIKSNLSADESILNEKIDALQIQIDEVGTQHAKRKQELADAFKLALQQKGVDPRKESEAKQRKEASLAKAEEVKHYIIKINEFRAWDKNQWQTLPEKEKALATNALQLDTDRSALDALQKEFKEMTDGFNRDIKAIGSRIATAKELKDRIDGAQVKIKEVVAQIPSGHPAEGIDESSTIDELIAIGLQKTSEVSLKINKIRDNVKRVSNILSDAGGGNAYSDTWTEIKRQIVQTHHVDTNSDEYLLLCLDALSEFLTETLPNMRQLTMEVIRSAGERYVRFYQSLDSLNRKISAVSNKLEQSINTANKFPALDDVRVTLTSKIHDLDNFNELKAFNHMWDEWSEAGKHTLPTQSFHNAFSAAAAALKSGGIDSSLESLVDININLVENNRSVVIRCDADLTNSSSQGVSTLAVCVVFCGMTRFLCKDDNITIHWPLDELGKLDESNTILLFEFMDANNITLFCAQPTLNPVLMRYFPIKVNVVRGVGIQRCAPRSSSKANPLLANKEAM